MRRWINLFEETSTSPTYDEVEYYMNEGCGVFAYSLWIAKNKPTDGDIMMISNVDGEPWYGDLDEDGPSHDFEATHVYYMDGNGDCVDAKGYRTVQQMIDDFRIHADIHGPWKPEIFKNEWMGENDDKPLWFDNNTLHEALSLINKFPEFYRI